MVSQENVLPLASVELIGLKLVDVKPEQQPIHYSSGTQLFELIRWIIKELQSEICRRYRILRKHLPILFGMISQAGTAVT